MNQTDPSRFEENALLCIQKRDVTALKDLVVSQIDKTINTNENQAILLFLWLVQCLLSELAKARLQNDQDQIDLSSAELQSILEDFRLKAHIWKHRSKIYELLASYGDDDHFGMIAAALDDTEALVDFLMKRKRYSEVIPLIASKNNENLLIQHGPQLAKACPEEFFEILMIKVFISDPRKLLPAILQGVDETNVSCL